MKFNGVAVIVLVSWSWLVKAQQLSIANLTTCGLECLFETIPLANCSLSDTECQCSSTTLPQLTSACLLANCTMHDSLVVAKVTASQCDYPHPDRADVLIGVTSASLAVTTIFIFLRLFSKLWISGALGAEDWIIAAALFISYCCFYFMTAIAHEGFGLHIWDLNDGDLARTLKNFYIGESMYVVDVALSKISILVFYLRIFPHTGFRYAAYATIAMTAASTAIIFFMTVFACNPVPYFWNKDLHGQCISLGALAYANGGMNIVQDLIIIALPLPVLTKLNMNLKRKIGVAFMFVIGSFGCVISMIRLRALVLFGDSIDPTWDYVDIVVWTSLELAIAMICACLPAIRNLLMRLFPQAFLASGQSNTNSRKKYANSQGWRATGSKIARPDGRFLELADGMGHSETVDSPAVSTAELAPKGRGEESGKKGSVPIEVVEEV